MASLAEDVAACHFLEDLVDGPRLKLLGGFLAVPLLVVTYVTAKVAER
jgi:hypothetical protein